MSEHIHRSENRSNAVGISVVLATRNRAEVLRQTLDAFCNLEDPGVPWELIVADDGSTDRTRDVAESFGQRLPLRCVYEGRPGKCNALNSGIPQARYDLILLTDDDITPCEEWLRAYAEAATLHPECSFFGGDIYGDASGVVLPRWARQPDGRPLDWVAWNWKINSTSPEQWSFAGGNVAYRSVLFSQYGFFPTYLGHVDGKVAGGEERWFQSRLRAGGEQPWYVSEAWVKHRLRQDEFTIRHWLRRAWHTCAASARVSYDQGASRLGMARAIAHDVRRAASFIARMIKAVFRWDQGELVHRAAQLACMLGRIVAHSRLILASMTRNGQGE